MADVTVGNATHAALFIFAAEEAIDWIVPTSVARLCDYGGLGIVFEEYSSRRVTMVAILERRAPNRRTITTIAQRGTTLR